MEQDAMDRSIERRRPLLPLFAAMGFSVVAVVAVIFLADRNPDVTGREPKTPSVATASQAAASTSAPNQPTAEKIPSKDVADAFEAATGHRAAFSVADANDVIITRPTRIVRLPFGRALLTEVEIENGCHSCVGAIGIYYLGEQAGKTIVTKSWPRAIRGWTLGYPPTDWEVTDKFTTYPAIFATGGFMMGSMISGATVTELRPEGPIESDEIKIQYSDAVDPDTGQRHCALDGRIANIRKDGSFNVVVTGSARAVDRYRKVDGRFKAVATMDWDFPCGPSESMTRKKRA
jgi:hypothetical protein